MVKLNKKHKKKISKRVNNTFNANFLYFDRPEYYKNKVQYKSKLPNRKGVLVNFDNLKKYDGVGGVWSKWGINEKGKAICLDVSQNYDIGKEMAWTYKYLLRGKKHQDLSNEEIKAGGYRGPRQLIKYRNIAYYWPVEYRIVSTNIKTKLEREQIEMEYAHKYKSLFWYPCQGNQKKQLKKYMIPFRKYQEKYK